jgi:hypothetical protein
MEGDKFRRRPLLKGGHHLLEQGRKLITLHDDDIDLTFTATNVTRLHLELGQARTVNTATISDYKNDYIGYKMGHGDDPLHSLQYYPSTKEKAALGFEKDRRQQNVHTVQSLPVSCLRVQCDIVKQC